MESRVLVVGGGHAGGRVAQELARLGGFDVTVVSAEDYPPYERPRLSKELLRGDATATECFVWPADDPAWTKVNMVRDVVEDIDREHRTIKTRDGLRLSYDYLVLATGASIRKVNLPATHVHVLRTINDSERLTEALRGKQRALVIGGGFIGLEIAATAVGMGIQSSVIEISDRLLGRLFPKEIAGRLQAEHVRRGVDFHFGVTIEEVLETPEGELIGARLSNGNVMSCDLIVAAPGVTPNTDLARRAGLDVSGGVLVDSAMRTSDARIYACGDVASVFLDFYGRHVQVESWHAAQTQPSVVANNIAGIPTVYSELPFYWSDQFDKSVQAFGIPSLGIRSIVSHETDDELILLHVDARQRVLAATGIGRPSSIGRPLRQLRAKIIAGNPSR